MPELTDLEATVKNRISGYPFPDSQAGREVQSLRQIPILHEAGANPV